MGIGKNVVDLSRVKLFKRVRIHGEIAKILRKYAEFQGWKPGEELVYAEKVCNSALTGALGAAYSNEGFEAGKPCAEMFRNVLEKKGEPIQ